MKPGWVDELLSGSENQPPRCPSATENALSQLIHTSTSLRKPAFPSKTQSPTRRRSCVHNLDERCTFCVLTPDHAQFRVFTTSMQSPGLIRQRPVSLQGDRAMGALYSIFPRFLAKRFGSSFHAKQVCMIIQTATFCHQVFVSQRTQSLRCCAPTTIDRSLCPCIMNITRGTNRMSTRILTARTPRLRSAIDPSPHLLWRNRPDRLSWMMGLS